MLEYASAGGHATVVQWLLSLVKQLDVSGGPFDAMFAAVEGGCLDMMKWLCERYCISDLFQDQEMPRYDKPRGLQWPWMLLLRKAISTSSSGSTITDKKGVRQVQ